MGQGMVEVSWLGAPSVNGPHRLGRDGTGGFPAAAVRFTGMALSRNPCGPG